MSIMNDMDEEMKGFVVSLSSELIDKIHVLQRRYSKVEGYEPIDFATFAEELRGETAAISRLISMMQGKILGDYKSIRE